jgi:NSS family neurotransmitter:Na+ symporter
LYILAAETSGSKYYIKMVINDLSNRGKFGTKFGIIAAAAGSAIGLGNIWRFPYVAGANGGGAFLLIYVIFVFGIGVPIMLSEFVIGRSTQRNPFDAFKKLKPNSHWYIIGIMGIIAAFMILAFYGTVAGWTLEYLYQSIINGFKGKDVNAINQMFDNFNSATLRPVMWQMIFMILTAAIVIGGVEKGIEKYTKILMPLLLVILIILDIRALLLPGAGEGIDFLFKPDFSKINPKVILEALGQAFFSLSIGMGTLITYGSYIHKRDNMANSAVFVSIADTAIAILAGVAIFPIIYSFNLEPDQGVGLVFKILPNIFQQMTGGYILALLFFILLTVAALTSSISVLEVVVAFFVERLKMKRIHATLFATISISYLGTLCAMSAGGFSDFQLFNRNVLGLLDSTASKILLPLGGCCIALFVGWFYGKGKTWREVSNRGTLKTAYLNIFMFLIKYIAPIAIALVFLNGLGIIRF